MGSQDFEIPDAFMRALGRKKWLECRCAHGMPVPRGAGGLDQVGMPLGRQLAAPRSSWMERTDDLRGCQ